MNKRNKKKIVSRNIQIILANFVGLASLFNTRNLICNK